MVSGKMKPLSYAAYALSEEVRLEYSGYVFDPEKASRKSILFLSLYFKFCDFTTRKLLNQFNGWYEG